MTSNWQPNSWRDKPAKHIPTYSNDEELCVAREKLSNFPPLDFAGESRNLLKQLEEVS